MRRLCGIAILALATTPLLGCTPAGADDATRAASRFVELARADPAGACRLLAPETSRAVAEDGDGECATGLQKAGLPEIAPGGLGDAVVAGGSAQVRSRTATLFLARFDSGWLVTAAGCLRERPDPAVPYACAIQGE